MTIEEKCCLEVTATAALAKWVVGVSQAINEYFVAYTELMARVRMDLPFNFYELSRIARAEDELLALDPTKTWIGNVGYFEEIIESIDPNDQAWNDYYTNSDLLRKMRNLLVREDIAAEVLVLALFDGLAIARRKVIILLGILIRSLKFLPMPIEVMNTIA